MSGNGLHVGLVGVGRIGVFHARALAELEGVGAVTVADADVERARRVAAELGFGVADTPEELVEAGVEALVIASSTPSHVPLLELAAGAGCRRSARNPSRSTSRRSTPSSRRSSAPGSSSRSASSGASTTATARRETRSPPARVGNLLLLRAATHDPEPPTEAYVASSGGIFRDLHIHDFDAVRFVTGEDVAEVYADGAVRETPWFDRHDDVDAAAAILRLQGGALAVFTGTRRDPLGYDVRLEVFGTRDSIVVGVDPRTPLRSLERGGSGPRPVGYRDFLDRFDAAYRAELEAFVATVANGGQSPCPLSEVRAALVVALAADRSRAERRPVSIEEVTSAEAVAG